MAAPRTCGCARSAAAGRTRAHAVGLLIALVAALLLLPAGAGAQSRAPRDSIEVHGLRFEGVRTLPEELVRASIVTSGPRCRNPVLFFACWAGMGIERSALDENVLRADVLRLRVFYYQRGYRGTTVNVESTIEAGRADVVFTIDEGVPVRVASIEIEGGDDLLPGDVAERLPLRRGDPLDLIAFEASRDTLLSTLKNRGYAHAEVLSSYLIPRTDSLQAQVKFEVHPGALARFGEISVAGADRVSPAVVRKMLTLGEGDLYRQDELLRSQRNLFGLEIFRHVEVRADLAAGTDSVVPVRVQVNEGNVHRVRAGIGMSTAECGNAEGRWVSRNFLGGARRLELSGRVSNVLAETLGRFPCFDTGTGVYSDLNGSLAADFAQPWFFSPLNTFGAGTFVERRSVPDVFVRTALGGYLSLSRVLGSRKSVTVSYRPELTRLDAEGDLFFCINFVSCAVRDIPVLRDPHWLAPFAASFTRDRTNAIFSPTRGDILRIDGEFASDKTGSDFAYARIAAEMSVYREVTRGVVLAARLSPGWARSTGEPGDGKGLGLHPQKRFFSGGPNSVRGFAQYRLGPQVLQVDSRDLTAPIDQGGAGCSPETIADGSCDATGLDPGRFTARPVGGAALFEGNLEMRFPIFGDKLRGAVFLDVGQVWAEADEVRLADLAWSPGLGVRYATPIGPIRVDIGYNGRGGEALPVITTDVEDRSRLRPLDAPVFWDPNAGGFLNRIQLHFSIGQAF